MGEYLRGYDWDNSSLGPISQWPQSLLTAVSLCMASSFPMAVWWGPKFVLIYNDGYSVVAAGKHPWLFGKEGSTGWSEIWPTLEPMAESVMNGQNCYSEDHLLFMTRNGFMEETYHTWSYIPIRREDGSVGGLLNPSIESTEKVISERRLKTLRNLGTLTAGAKRFDETFSLICQAFESNTYDIPFALIYSCVSPLGSMDDSIAEKISQLDAKFKLAATVGISDNHAAAPHCVDISDHNNHHPWKDVFCQALKNNAKIQISNIGDLFFDLPTRGWGDSPREAVACPIVGSDQENVLGMLLIGLNPRRSYDEDYKTFIELLSRQAGTSLATVRAYEDQVRRAETLAAVDRAKTAFFSSVSHELRTPLTLILGPIKETLADQNLAPEQKSKLNMVLRNSKRLLRLVNSLLDFSRIEAGKLQATYRETNLGMFTADLASLFRSAIEKSGLIYKVECDESGRSVWVDPEMWEKIVFNLIGNAFKFTLKGSIKVTLQPAPDRSCVVFSVADTGSGVPSHEINKIFERFHRIEGQKGRSHEGTGIGLSLTQELVKLHGGQVEVKSEYGKGSTFSVTIPYGSAHVPHSQLLDSAMQSADNQQLAGSWSYGLSVVEEARLWLPTDDEDLEYLSATSSTDSNNGATNTFPISSSGSKILLVDDNSDMRRYVKGLLNRWWKITEASDGEEAFNLAVQNPPDLIVSDVMMPILDGIGLLKLLRTHQKTQFIPVILLSARAGEDARVEGLKAGADDFLVKPFSAKELIARVHTHLELGKLRSELERLVIERTKELAESELRYRVLTKLSPVGIFRLDLNGIITYTNDKWWQISGHDRKQDPGALNFMSSIYHEDRERTTSIFKECIQKAKGFIIEFRWNSINEYDDQLKPRGFVGTLTDITERKMLEKERLRALQLAEQQQRRRAEDAEEIKRQQELFIDMTCHEFRNPLNGIYHNADFLYESLEKLQNDVRNESILKVMNWLNSEIEEDLEAVATITLCAQHQKKIADDVLNMSKISMNLLVLAKTEFQPHAVVTNVLRMFETEVKLKNIALEFKVGEEFSRRHISWVKGDPTRLSQVLINFLTNAIRFTEKDSDQDQDNISISSSTWSTSTDRHLPECISNPGNMDDIDPADAVYVEISIRDSGVGMTTEEQASLFRRFTQASPKTYAEFGGSGLGLFISKRLVELHGGSIKVHSVKGSGTTFSFFIKCERSEEKGAPQTEQHEVKVKNTQSPTKSEDSTTSPISSKRILVVEDNIINQRVLKRQLELARYSVHVAKHGLEALEILKAVVVDLILMDLEMPVMGGLECTKHIRQDGSNANLCYVPIIGVSGNTRTEYKHLAMEAGMSAYITKPYNKGELIQLIDDLIDHTTTK
ncbi:hypothetical protein K493DRAFT_253700 [Basidiobolus meristosporus CBS 931.73]|uniref:histidine kinase n=1 Tax=Basidiobolus meristosporus CBS 931.73 TaxID=1314790 RepID=A0A1Y1Z1L3_9FUNG|nr:hypothetical protein K493DRAFT_253700 [Basidiobolus meristosporus CBS 931.73]|eukprot:ORY04188.1 hypothetical protein K493DRAFT_253700 [Basidiobolus meristosporus CBS 931.73]